MPITHIVIDLIRSPSKDLIGGISKLLFFLERNCSTFAEVVKNVNLKQLPGFSEIPRKETIFISFQQNVIGHLYFCSVA